MAGTWQPLQNQPTFHASTMLLLTDGTVLCHDEGASFGGTPSWWKLSPDATGSYVRGTWSTIASLPNAPLFFASAVLADGRVFLAGGEYNNGVSSDLKTVQLYDPVGNTWTSIAPPPGWYGIGDAPCCVLPDGRLLLGSIFDTRTAIFNPATNSWVPSGSKVNGDTSSDEESWVLLADGSVLSVDCFSSKPTTTQRYVPTQGTWQPAGNTISNLVEASSHEIGPAVMLTDGRVFAIGATGRTGLYTPVGTNQPGTWADGPVFPAPAGQTWGAKDAPACLLPNGRVLCVAGPVDGVSGDYNGPTHCFEFDPWSGSLTPVPNPPNSGNAPFNGCMLLLPTGQVLYASGGLDIEVYTPDGAPDPGWAPAVVDCPATLLAGHVYTLSGRQFNGLSQAVMYGDDRSMATNYPLVQLRHPDTGQVTYCRTFNHSTMAVATGQTTVTTQFLVPNSVAQSNAELAVIANGITSAPVNVAVGSWSGWSKLADQAVEADVAANQDGRLEVFKIGTDASLTHIYQTAPNGGWGSGSTLGAGLTHTAAARNQDGRLEVVGVVSDQTLQHIYQTAPNGVWSPWSQLGTGILKVAIAVNQDGRLELLAITTDHDLNHLYQTALNGGWSPRSNLGAGITDAVAASNQDGRIEVFATFADRAVNHIYQTAPNGGWSNWAPLGTSALQLATAVNQDGRVEVLTIGVDHTLNHAYQTAPNGGWSGWSALGSNYITITSAANVDGRIEVFGVTTDGVLNHIYQTVPNGGWSPWSSLGAGVAQVNAAKNQDGRIEVFAIDVDQTLNHCYQNVAGL